MEYKSSKKYHSLFSVLADPTRLAILELLYEGQKNINEIAKALNQEKNIISNQIKYLKKIMFVFPEVRKKETTYLLNKEIIEPIFEMLTFHSNKYYLTKGKSQTKREIQKLKKKEAAKTLYITHL